MASTRDHRRAVLAALLLFVTVAAAACGAGGEEPSARPSRTAERTSAGEPDPTGTRPERTSAPDPAASPTRSPEEPEPERTTRSRPPEEPEAARTTTAATAAEPARTTTTATAAAEPEPAESTTRPPTRTAVAAPPPPATTRPPATPDDPAPVQTASAAAAAGESSGLGPFGWLVLLALAAALVVGGVLVARSQRRSAWDTEARALESETRAIATVRLPPVLDTTTTGRRGLAWPPVRADLSGVLDRWIGLTERAPGEARRSWASRVAGLIQSLIAAVDTENAALAAGQDWRRRRPEVDRATDALGDVLSGPRPEPPPAAEPGPPAFQP